MTPLTMTLLSSPFTLAVPQLLVKLSKHSNQIMLKRDNRWYFNIYSTEFQRSLRMTIVDFIGSVGGLFGLCLGFSLISFFELLYWFLVRTARGSLSSLPSLFFSWLNLKPMLKGLKTLPKAFFLSHSLFLSYSLVQMEKFKAWDEKTESTKHSCFRHRGDRENGHQWWHLPERYQRWHLNGRHHWRRHPSKRHHWREDIARPYTSNCFSMSRVGIYSYHRQQLDHRQLQYHRQHWHHWQLSDHRHISHNRYNLDVAFDKK